MDIGDWFLLLIRWLHALAAAAWIGGGFFSLLVLRPVLRNTPHEVVFNRVARVEFRNLVHTAISVLLVTGAVLSVDRLSTAHVGGAYGAVLGLKIALAVWMFYLVWFRQRRGAIPPAQPQELPTSTLLRAARATSSATNLILVLGVVVFLLAAILRNLFEQGIAGR